MAKQHNTTRRALVAGATISATAPAAVAAIAAPAPSAAAEAYRKYRAESDAFEGRPTTDDENDAFVMSIEPPLRKAISDAPCDSKSAAIAKLRYMHEESLNYGEVDSKLIAQVLHWLEVT